MKIYHSLTEYVAPQKPVSLTVGNFDGVHKGHQAVLNLLKAKQENNVVITFSNHPASVIRPEHQISLICTLEHRLKLLNSFDIGQVILLEFNHDLAKQTARTFIQELRQTCPFKNLVLGYDATLGRDRQGGRQEVQEIAQHCGFDLDYAEPMSIDNLNVSSSQIRKLIREGNLSEASALLGRPFSVYQTVTTGLGIGKKIGFPTLNIPTQNLCLPPLGVYSVRVIHNNETFRGVANLGTAPTVRKDPIPVLEVHLIEGADLVQDTLPLEVIFHHYIRPEKQFPSLEELKKQIAADVQRVKSEG